MILLYKIELRYKIIINLKRKKVRELKGKQKRAFTVKAKKLVAVTLVGAMVLTTGTLSYNAKVKAADIKVGTPYILQDNQVKYNVNEKHIVINQICGASKSSSTSSGFVELYNPTSEDVDLTGWSVQYKSSVDGGASAGWQKCDLTGKIPAQSSYLIKGKEVNANAEMQVKDGDVNWDISMYTKGMTVVLLSNQQQLADDANPFDNVKKEPTVDGYVDMLAVNGNDSLDTQKALAYEGQTADIQSKKKGIRRVDFRDTDNNAEDAEEVNFSNTDEGFQNWAAPKNSSDGPWESSSNPASKPQTSLSSTKPNTLTNMAGSDASTTRLFTWQMPTTFESADLTVYADENLTTVVAESKQITPEVYQSSGIAKFKTEITGLQAGTKYYYQIKSGDMTSDVYSFTTYKGGEFTFVHASDTQALSKRDYAVWGNAINTVVKAYNPEFILETGDLINTKDREDEWRWFFDSAANVLNQYAFYPAVGNHEQTEDYDAQSFRQHFSMSNTCDVEGVTPGTVYSFDYGIAHFVVINTENKTALETQAKWADADIKKANKKVNIIAAHRGIYGARGIEQDVFDAFENVLSDNNIDLVLFGHDHSYIRSTIKEGVKNPNGTVFLESGGSSVKQMEHADKKPEYSEITADPGKSAFSVITVSETKISVKTITVDSEGTIDSLENCGKVIKSDDSMTIDFTIDLKNEMPTETTSDEQTTTENPTTSATETTTESETTTSATSPTTKVNPTTTGNVRKLGTTKIIKATKNRKASKIKLSFKKVTGAKRYYVQISTSKKFKKPLVKKVVKSTKATITNKRLKNKKKLYVRVKAVGATKWSKPKRITVKK